MLSKPFQSSSKEHFGSFGVVASLVWNSIGFLMTSLAHSEMCCFVAVYFIPTEIMTFML